MNPLLSDIKAVMIFLFEKKKGFSLEVICISLDRDKALG
jgi:hypothetical protein